MDRLTVDELLTELGSDPAYPRSYGFNRRATLAVLEGEVPAEQFTEFDPSVKVVAESLAWLVRSGLLYAVRSAGGRPRVVAYRATHLCKLLLTEEVTG